MLGGLKGLVVVLDGAVHGTMAGVKEVFLVDQQKVFYFSSISTRGLEIITDSSVTAKGVLAHSPLHASKNPCSSTTHINDVHNNHPPPPRTPQPSACCAPKPPPPFPHTKTIPLQAIHPSTFASKVAALTIYYRPTLDTKPAEDVRLAWALYDLYALRGHLHARSTSVGDAMWSGQVGRVVEKMSGLLLEVVRMVESDQQDRLWNFR